jgi:DNA-directed RNA polymerase specialized sigma24 family protein
MINPSSPTRSLEVAISQLPRTGEQQYWYDAVTYGHRLSPEEEDALLERARAGNLQARQDICQCLFGWCAALAARYARAYDWAYPRIEFQDLAQLGVLTMLSVMDQALSSPSPFGYIRVAVRRAIIQYCPTHVSLITTPTIPRREHRKKPIRVISLDKPIEDKDGDTYTLADFLADSLMELPPGKEYPLLDSFIDALPPQQRETILRHYGLREHHPETLLGIAKERGVIFSSVWGSYAGGLSNLRQGLLKGQPVKRSATRKSIPLKQLEQLGSPEQRLEKAYQHLLTQPGPITLQKLGREAHCNDRTARRFLVEQGALLPSGRPRLTEDAVKERLEDAYQYLLTQPDTITTQRLSRRAHCGDQAARNFLVERGVLLPSGRRAQKGEKAKARLEDAYQYLLTQPGPITLKRLVQEAHCIPETARSFLASKREEEAKPAESEARDDK